MASGDDRAVSDAALWMLLLLRLATVTTDERLELRNSKFGVRRCFLKTLLTLSRCYSDFATNLRCLWRSTWW